MEESHQTENPRKKKPSCRTAVARGLGFQGQTYETRLILRFFTYGF
jgi:hypothetical protein